MTFIASDFINADQLQRFAVVSDAATRMRPGHPSFASWLSEHRTFSIGLPRQTGKTTALMSLADESTVVMFPTHRMLDYAKREYSSVSAGLLFTPYSFADFAHSFSTLHNPLKITRIFMDEFDFAPIRDMENVMHAINFMHARRALADDVFILKVGTPRC